MRHPHGARRRRWGGLALDGGLVLAAILVHRRYLRDTGVKDATCDPLGVSNRARKRVKVYLSPVFPQIARLLGNGKILVSHEVKARSL